MNQSFSPCPECGAHLVTIGKLDFEAESASPAQPRNIWDDLAPRIEAKFDRRWNGFMRQEFGEECSPLKWTGLAASFGIFEGNDRIVGIDALSSGHAK